MGFMFRNPDKCHVLSEEIEKTRIMKILKSEKNIIENREKYVKVIHNFSLGSLNMCCSIWFTCILFHECLGMLKFQN